MLSEYDLEEFIWAHQSEFLGILLQAHDQLAREIVEIHMEEALQAWLEDEYNVPDCGSM